MKFTHLLVPVRVIEKIENTYSFEQDMSKAIAVDLSEEGIEEKAKLAKKLPLLLKLNFVARTAYSAGYQQCAKDLLNTKP